MAPLKCAASGQNPGPSGAVGAPARAFSTDSAGAGVGHLCDGPRVHDASRIVLDVHYHLAPLPFLQPIVFVRRRR